MVKTLKGHWNTESTSDVFIFNFDLNHDKKKTWTDSLLTTLKNIYTSFLNTLYLYSKMACISTILELFIQIWIISNSCTTFQKYNSENNIKT